MGVGGFSERQYMAARHNDKDHEHIHVAINKIHPESFRIHSPAWDHQKLFEAGRELSKPRLCERLGDLQPAPPNHLEAARHTAHQYSPMPARVPRTLWNDYTQSLDQGRLDRSKCGNEAVATKKGSYQMQGDAVEMQIGDPNGV